MKNITNIKKYNFLFNKLSIAFVMNKIAPIINNMYKILTYVLMSLSIL